MTSRRSGTVFWLHVLLDCDELDPTETLLLVALADHVDEHDTAFPSLHLLARRARVSYATTKRRMADLVERGYVVRVRRHGAGGRRSTYSYRFQRPAFGLGATTPETPIFDPDTGAQPEPWTGPDRVQSAPRSRAHQGEPTEVPSIEPEEEEQPGSAADLDDDLEPIPEPDDTLVADLAQRLFELRNADLPDRPVGQPAAWLKKARRRLRADDQLPKRAVQVRHPALGCMADRDRHLAALAHRQRADAWPSVPTARRLVAPADRPPELDHERATPMPASVRAALTGGPRR